MEKGKTGDPARCSDRAGNRGEKMKKNRSCWVLSITSLFILSFIPLAIADSKEEETAFWDSVEDGQELNMLHIIYAISKVAGEPKPKGSCSHPSVIQAKKIPSDYRGKKVCSHGKVVQISTEKIQTDGELKYVTHGIISTNRGDATMFYIPGKAEGYFERTRMRIIGYFIQNYTYQTNLGFFNTAPIIVGYPIEETK